MNEINEPNRIRGDRPMPWDEPSRLEFYGVDPGEYGNRQRTERKAAAEAAEQSGRAEGTR